MIQQGEFAGFVVPPGDTGTFYKTAKRWVQHDPLLNPAAASVVASRMAHEGFAGVWSRQLGTSSQRSYDGLSWVMQLRSPSAARAEVAGNVSDAKTHTNAPATYSAFAVSSIPGAHGYQVGSATAGGMNVVFADGPFVYLVGVGWQSTPPSLPSRGSLISAARKLYARVHGHPLPPPD